MEEHPEGSERWRTLTDDEIHQLTAKTLISLAGGEGASYQEAWQAFRTAYPEVAERYEATDPEES